MTLAENEDIKQQMHALRLKNAELRNEVIKLKKEMGSQMQ
jgi:hypothetical protein